MVSSTYNFVPVQLANTAFAQVLLRTSNIVAGRHILNDLLTNPAAVQEARLGIGEAPLEVRYDTVVSRLLPEVARVLQVNLLAGAA